MAADASVGYIDAVSATLARVTSEVEKLEERIESARRDLSHRFDSVQAQIHGLQSDRLHEIDMRIAEVRSLATATDKAVERIAGAQTWLIRTVAGAIIIGVIAAALSYFRSPEIRYVQPPPAAGAVAPGAPG